MLLLRQEDRRLADTYLDATARYLDMYEKLIGPYPYKELTLAEDFRENGYGMPSLTLMGSEVIRFPFIAHPSHPHEILHNCRWPGVFRDLKSSNRSDGLTASFQISYHGSHERGCDATDPGHPGQWSHVDGAHELLHR